MSNNKVNAEIGVYLGSDTLEFNGYIIHEISLGEIGVYTPKQLEEMDENPECNDYPVFKYMCNALSYCLGHVDENMLKSEEDLKEYLKRKEESK